MAMTITSPAFGDGESIPVQYTADGDDISPPLQFDGVPDEAVELALICHDPDAPRAGGWTHWVAWGMAPDIGGLPENVPPDPKASAPGVTQGENSWGRIGYGGPSPPPGRPHRYQFTLYALSAPVGLEPGASAAALEAAMGRSVVAEAMLTGICGR